MTDSEHIIAYLRSMDEQDMAASVINMHNRLEAFASGLDRECRKVLTDRIEALEKHNAELLAALMNAHHEIATADLQIGDGHIQNARKTLDSVFEAIDSTVSALQPSTQEVSNERL